MLLLTASFIALAFSIKKILIRAEALLPGCEKLLDHSNHVASEIDLLVSQTHRAASAWAGQLDDFVRNTRAFLLERFGFNGMKPRNHRNHYRRAGG